ncbi:KilA-N domain-containing protein [Albimonas pacifica]|uniref:KilA-N domain-containing protein n=1 Tax=Albimonas pacifica TaxID=1114924 RepID=A0A1I3LJH4_9RHOB|nr:KilA-N domain-containing protein [Albimonas pacifica]SFI84626.1 KilA-N domain-containing protein [Albimonas pacifica]
MKTSISSLSFNDTPIRDREQMLCLTDMWKAAGSPRNKKPAEWSRYEGSDFIREIGEKVGTAHLFENRPGRGGGTWAHWQIGMAYAKYLSPAFHAWCNEVVRAYMEGTPPPSPQDTRWLAVRQESRAMRNDFTSTLAEHGVTKPRDFARATNATYVGLFGASAGRMRERMGLPKKANLRDRMSRMELAQVILAEELATEHMEDERSWGADECCDVTAMAARSVHQAVSDNRASRRRIGR